MKTARIEGVVDSEAFLQAAAAVTRDGRDETDDNGRPRGHLSLVFGILQSRKPNVEKCALYQMTNIENNGTVI